MHISSSNGITVKELAEKLGLNTYGDVTRVICDVAPPEKGTANSVCVVWDEKSLKALSPEVMMIGRQEFFSPERSGLISEDPKRILPSLLKLFTAPRPVKKGIHQSAVVAESARVSPEAWIGPFCVIEDNAFIGAAAQLVSHVHIGCGVSVGDGTIIEPQTVLMDGTEIGKNCLLHSGCVLGCDGFGFQPSQQGIVKIPQIGNTIIADNVEIGACTTIDRGTIGNTVIGSSSKIDNHVQIGHNVQIGSCCIICSMSGIAGSSIIEDGVTISAQVGITDHVRIGKGAILAGRSGVTNDIQAGTVVSGFPARPHKEALRAQVVSLRLPELQDRIKRLERTVFPK